MTNAEREIARDDLNEALVEVKSALQRLETMLESSAIGRQENCPPANAGTPWTSNEEHRLLKDHLSGLTARELSEKYQRTINAINARLVKLATFDNSGSPNVAETTDLPKFSCTNCEQPVPIERIRALVGKVRCTTCQEELEQNNREPY